MAEAISIPSPGDVVAGKYRVTRLIGEGGMGVVLAAEHLRLRQPIAIKFLNPEMLAVDEIVQRFEREARAAATLRSRHVVRVTDVEVTAEGVPYMVMELLIGADLESERERRKCLPHAEVVDYILQACSALAEAHDAGIIHRDLKPGNLFLAHEEDQTIVKVLDFGISKFMSGDDAKLTSAGAIMGTALYMPPEQIRGDASVDARSDIWSLGVILYELISGNAPWIGPTTRVAAAIVSEDAPDIRQLCAIPEALARTIHWMLEKSAARRPQSIADVAFALAPFAPHGSVGAACVEQLQRRSQRSLGPRARPVSSPDLASVAATLPHVSTRLSPDRSTMAATTTNANMTSAAPRALVGALVAFVTLAVAGIALIIFVTRAKSTDAANAANAAASMSATAETSALPASPSVPDGASATPVEAAPVETAAPAASIPSTPPAPTAAPAKHPSGPKTSTPRSAPSAPTTRPAPKPTETAPSGNPLFLK